MHCKHLTSAVTRTVKKYELTSGTAMHYKQLLTTRIVLSHLQGVSHEVSHIYFDLTLLDIDSYEDTSLPRALSGGIVNRRLLM